ncbi:hypothetical protein [Streptomyces sp. NPDC090021]|uniref:hypothetical protein n=1 Tax=Streptomyces sp. NPDC090021 TaxID=3365919 RepID=UPI0038228283
MTRDLAFGLYADERGLADVTKLVEAAVAPRSARIVAATVIDPCPYDFLAEQWAVEHPGRDSGTRRTVELRVRLTCSLRTWRFVRRAVITSLCPEGPHACAVPWFAL